MKSLVFYNHQHQEINEITGTCKKNNNYGDDSKRIKQALQNYWKNNGYSEIPLI